jgi:hypothetical protein
MNATRIASAAAFVALTTLSLAGTSTAFAQEAKFEPVPASSSSLTRAQVQADLFKARADGTSRFGSAGYIEPLRNSRAPEAVRAETLAAIANGEARAIQSEVYAWTPANTAVRLARAR